jgi:hypothetical protein
MDTTQGIDEKQTSEFVKAYINWKIIFLQQKQLTRILTV